MTTETYDLVTYNTTHRWNKPLSVVHKVGKCTKRYSNSSEDKESEGSVDARARSGAGTSWEERYSCRISHAYTNQ